MIHSPLRAEIASYLVATGVGKSANDPTTNV